MPHPFDPMHIQAVLDLHQLKANSSRRRKPDLLRKRRATSKREADSSRNPNSHQKFTKEQEDWIRYHREDLGRDWRSTQELFGKKFSQKPITALTSFFYRSQRVPKLNENNQPVQYGKGNFVMIDAPVRLRLRENWPSRLVDLHPEFAVIYDWVMQESKEEANKILQILDGRTKDSGNVSQSEFTL
jgi:hypothetical protein